ncbi:hypothetical protein [Brevibacillus fulvus]|uniref:Uncharacterized protein n=1 Tax=Brevibacillus fulvus TaxID=1125967 RepID=A0A938XW69_9BACL|nr:hypothetical protein [Brevibacillus fulvus]MBM7588830.1 hypothetical protein [Brevibacillus fulvus]
MGSGLSILAVMAGKATDWLGCFFLFGSFQAVALSLLYRPNIHS